MLHLFSANPKNLAYAIENYRQKSAQTSTLIREVFSNYSEDLDMDSRLKEFVQESQERFLKKLSVEERVKGLPAEEVLKNYPAEEVLRNYPAEEVLKIYPDDERVKGVSAEARLKGLSLEELAQCLSAEKLEALEQIARQNRQRLYPNQPDSESTN